MPSTITIDPTAVDVLTCAQAGRLLPGKPSPSCCWRWMKRGYGQTRIRLQYAKVGRRMITNRAALTEFCRRIAELDQAPNAAVDEHADHRDQELVEAGL